MLLDTGRSSWSSCAGTYSESILIVSASKAIRSACHSVRWSSSLYPATAFARSLAYATTVRSVVNSSIRLGVHLLSINTPEAQPTTSSPVTASCWTFCSSVAPKLAPHHAQNCAFKATLRPQAAQNSTFVSAIRIPSLIVSSHIEATCPYCFKLILCIFVAL